MKPNLTRRDFLKFASLFSLSHAVPASIKGLPSKDKKNQNVLILVFDAWSAANMSLYGYERETTPKLERLAENAIVYHNHYAGSHYTTPGTASLLTGTTPWTHHAFNVNATVRDILAEKSIFHAFPGYHRLGYSHNAFADTLLRQFIGALDTYTPWERLYFENDAVFTSAVSNDIDIAAISKARALRQQDDGFSFSLFLSRLYEAYKKKRMERISADFPRGVPDNEGVNFFLLEDGIDWVLSVTETTPQPFLGYYHFFPPHDPYHTREEFYNVFAHDGYEPINKPEHFFERMHSQEKIDLQRRWYDEFILYVDAEFERLYRQLEQNDALDNTWLIVTTDHGEMFSRGILGHTKPIFYQPVMHVPLIVFPPGQDSRVDIHERTSALDLLPTLLQVTGQAEADWAEGTVLPPFPGSEASKDRTLTSVQIEKLNKDGSIKEGTAMIIKDHYELFWFFGYEPIQEQGDVIELYDLDADPEELNNLYPQQKEVAEELLGILRIELEQLDQSYG